MSGKTNKKTKDDLADFFLGNDKVTSSQQNTTVLNPLKSVEPDKTSVLSAEEKTKSISIQKSKLTEPITKPEEYKPNPTREVTPSAPRENFFNKDNIDPSLFSLEAAIKQSEYLRIAQGKVKNLEKQVDELKSENETLSTSAIVLQKKYDELARKIDMSKMDQKAQVDNLKDESVLKDRIINELQKEKDQLQRKNDEFQSLMSEKIQHVRVRERELQNRLEILQHEGDVVITNKDEMILDLKKQMDQFHFEMDSYKAQARELNNHIQSQKEQIRRSTKALRLALTLLENEDIDVSEIKKTGT
ncbi:MAG: hypothetical protein V4596_13200 [Bdellovibrionota bacterium]